MGEKYLATPYPPPPQQPASIIPTKHFLGKLPQDILFDVKYNKIMAGVKNIYFRGISA